MLALQVGYIAHNIFWRIFIDNWILVGSHHDQCIASIPNQNKGKGKQDGVENCQLSLDGESKCQKKGTYKKESKKYDSRSKG